jgi:hypothetical protein
VITSKVGIAFAFIVIGWNRMILANRKVIQVHLPNVIIFIAYLLHMHHESDTKTGNK